MPITNEITDSLFFCFLSDFFWGHFFDYISGGCGH